MREKMALVAEELKRDRRNDLKRLVEQRKHTVEQMQSELEALEAMIDPNEDKKRIDELLKSRKAVDMQQYVVIPPVLHLTWKSKRLPYYGRANWKLWRKLNPGLKINVYDDDDIQAYVSKFFPEFGEFWDELKPVQKADVFRYVIMWNEGGVYADIDVEPLQPISSWMMNGTQNTLHWRNANVILGWEMITDREDWEEFFASQLQLCQWTFAASPKHELFRAVLDWLLDYFRLGNQMKYPSIIKSTGPGMFSNGVKAFLKKKYGADLGSPPLTIKELESKNLHVGDILLLKKSAFAPEVNWGRSEDSSLVRHGFAGSWKKSVGHAVEEAKQKPDTLAGTMEKQLARLRKELEVMQESMKEETKALKKKIRELKSRAKKEDGNGASKEGSGDNESTDENDGVSSTDETTTAVKQWTRKWNDSAAGSRRRLRPRGRLTLKRWGAAPSEDKPAWKVESDETTDQKTRWPKYRRQRRLRGRKQRLAITDEKRREVHKEREALGKMLEALAKAKESAAGVGSETTITMTSEETTAAVESGSDSGAKFAIEKDEAKSSQSRGGLVLSVHADEVKDSASDNLLAHLKRSGADIEAGEKFVHDHVKDVGNVDEKEKIMEIERQLETLREMKKKLA